MSRSRVERKLDRNGRELKVGDLVRVARDYGAIGGDHDFRRSLRRCTGRVLPIVGWDVTGLAWLPLRRPEVVSVPPRLLTLIRRGRVRGRNVAIAF